MTRLAALLAAMLLLLGGVAADKGETETELTSFSFSHSGMSADQIYSYSVYVENGVWLADFDLYCRFELSGVPMDKADRQALERIIADYSLWEWNGFTGNDSSCADGEGFVLRAVFADGRTLEASGINAFPKDYRQGETAIREFFEDFMDRHGIDPWQD